MLTLRPYQERGVLDIRQAFADKFRAPLYVLPTGGGKTVIFSHIAYGAANKGKRVYILSHRTELIDQISLSLAKADTPHGFIAADYPYIKTPCMVASIATLHKRLEKVPPPDLLVVDEAHHARARTWEETLKYWPQAKILGVTATPMRPSGEGLGAIFDKLILGPSPAELISLGYLMQPIFYGPETVDTSSLHTRGGEYITEESEALMDKPAIHGDVLNFYREKTHGLSALAFCVSVKHSYSVAEQFRAASYSAMALDGDAHPDVRRGVVADFRAKKITVLTSCDLFSEGFDCPGVEVGLMLRPTQSEVIYRQQCGRIMRPEVGVAHKYIFDHVRNWERFGLPHWDRAEPWTLEGEDKKTKKAPPSVKVCPKCWVAVRSGARSCPKPPDGCGHVFEIEGRQIDHRDGKMEEIRATQEEYFRQQEKKQLQYEQSQATTPEALAEIFRKRGYKGDLLGRARHVLAARAAKSRRSGE